VIGARPDGGTPSRRSAAPGDRRVSIVVPAYREARVIADTVRRLHDEVTDRLGDVEVVVVDDGSSDGTAALARGAGADVVVELPRNLGKGAAIRRGVEVAAGRTIVFTDADLAYSPPQVAELALLVEEGWDVVLGSRHADGAVAEVAASPVRRMGSWVVNRCVRFLVGGRSDTQCGLKAFRSDVARLLFPDGRIDGFGFDVELVALAERHHLAIATVPVRVMNSRGSSVRIVRDGVGLIVDLGRVAWWLRRDVYLQPGESALPDAGSATGAPDAEG
jgi:glycosyltransferase involved in cell wall biosynthesis